MVDRQDFNQVGQRNHNPAVGTSPESHSVTFQSGIITMVVKLFFGTPQVFVDIDQLSGCFNKILFITGHFTHLSEKRCCHIRIISPYGHFFREFPAKCPVLQPVLHVHYVIGCLIDIFPIFVSLVELIHFNHSCTHSPAVIQFLHVPKLPEWPVPVFAVIPECIFEIGIIFKSECYMIFGIIDIRWFIQVFAKGNHSHIEHSVGIMPFREGRFKFHICTRWDFLCTVIGFIIIDTHKLGNRLL